MTAPQGLSVLQVTDHWYPDKLGGSCKYAHELARLLQGQMRFVTMTLAGPIKPEEHDLTVVKTLSKLNFLANNLRVWRQIRAERVDCIFLHSPLAFLYVVFAALVTRTPMIAVFHGPWGQEARHKYGNRPGAKNAILAQLSFLLRMLDWVYLSAMRQVVFLSGYMRGQACAIRDVTAKSRIVPFWTTRPIPSLSARSVAPPYRLLVIRRLEFRMGIQDFLDVLDRAPAGTHLTIVGTGTYEQPLKDKVQALGLADQVDFAGRVSEADKDRLMEEADFMVLPSADLEGFGIVVLEAAEKSLPVICREGVGFLDFHVPEMDGAIYRYSDEGGLIELLSKPHQQVFHPQAFAQFFPDAVGAVFAEMVAGVRR